MKTHTFFRSDFNYDETGRSYFDDLLESIGIARASREQINSINIIIHGFTDCQDKSYDIVFADEGV